MARCLAEYAILYEETCGLKGLVECFLSDLPLLAS